MIGARRATELGVRIDGIKGLLGGSPERVLKTLYVTLHHLSNRQWSKKKSQIFLWAMGVFTAVPPGRDGSRIKVLAGFGDGLAQCAANQLRAQ